MDFLTACIVVIAVQLCMSIAMGGLYLVDPRQAAGSQYWAAAGLTSCAGAAVVGIGGPADTFSLAAGSVFVVLAAILQLRGVQDFFRRPHSRYLPHQFLAYLVGLLIVRGSGLPFAALGVLFSLFMGLFLALTLRVVWQQVAGRQTLGSRLVLAALVLLLLNHAVRLAGALFSATRVAPFGMSTGAVLVVYLIPLVGFVLYTVGLMLLYFERSVHEQRYLASHDSLTGLMNRRALVSAGESAIDLALSQSQPLSVALIDLDFFKRINDRLGHEAGDSVLVDVARLLAAMCRKNDMLGRYGGEEFIIVYPGMAAGECAGLGERLLRSARGYEYLGQRVTLSIGFASLRREDSWGSLLARADAQLYRAKSAGRDCYRLDVEQEESQCRGKQDGTAPLHDAA